ncbi:MAG TPA: ketosynthase chain-length factor [Pseudonocardiaceae bacterium]|nr:ketosynthase chain-length factor [Pseudonocardiaceae bacterium]
MTAAVTGIGVTAPTGLHPAEYWAATLAGRGGIGEVTGFDATRYPVRLVGQVRDFRAEERIPKRLLTQTDRVTRLALYAAAQALDDAGVTEGALPDEDMGVVLSNGQGGSDFTHREFRKLWTEGVSAVSVYESFAWFYAANTGQVSIRHRMRGPSSVLVGEQAGGLDAIGKAWRQVRSGDRLVVTGGVDSAFDPWGFIAQYSHGRVSRARIAERAYLPFDVAANGYVPAEGGAVLVLEDPASAYDRGVRSYGEIAGHAATFDPPPGSDRPGTLREAIRLALADADVTPEDVDVVFADSAGLPELDRAEADAIAAVFGPRAVPVTAPKAGYGRSGAGGGPLDVVTALQALRHATIPPTPYTADVPPEYGIDVVTGAARPASIRTALVLARGFGGFNSAVVVRAPA